MVNKDIRELREEATIKAFRAGFVVDEYAIFQYEVDLINNYVMVEVPLKKPNSTIAIKVNRHKQEPKKTTGCKSIW
jgi:hypothetical protein